MELENTVVRVYGLEGRLVWDTWNLRCLLDCLVGNWMFEYMNLEFRMDVRVEDIIVGGLQITVHISNQLLDLNECG